MEQEEQQEKGGKKRKGTRNKRKLEPITYEDAKKKIYDLIKQAISYSVITKKKFNIEGKRIKRFALSEISRIRKEFEQKEISSKTKTVSKNVNLDKAKIIKLLGGRWKLEDIVSSTKFDPTFVLTVFDEWQEMKYRDTTLIDEIYQILAEKGEPCENSEQVKSLISNAISLRKFVRETLKYRCSKCKKWVYLGPSMSTDWASDLMDALRYLSKNNWHHECGCSGPPCKT